MCVILCIFSALKFPLLLKRRSYTAVFHLLSRPVYKKLTLKVAKTQPGVLPFCVQQPVSVTSWTKAGMCGKSFKCIMIQLFLRFIGKERTGMVAPLWAEIRILRYFFCLNTDRATTKQSLEMGIFLHFLCIFRTTCIFFSFFFVWFLLSSYRPDTTVMVGWA